MIQVPHSPTVAPMPTDGSFLFPNEVFEWVCGSRACAYDCLVVCAKMAFRFQVKCFLTDGFQMLLVRALQIFPVGASLGSACCGVVVGFQNLVDERDYLRVN